MDSKFYEEIGKAVEYAKKNGGDLTTQNLLYVVKVAVNVAKETGADENDLISVGTEAMRKVELKYDPQKNDNFVKACALSVRGEMMNFVNRNSSLVHIPVNHQKGFRKGMDAREETKVSYHYIDESDYDTLGECSNGAFKDDKETILRRGLEKLDEFGRKVIKMKLKMDEYENIKYNNFQVMADELEVTVPIVKKIYKDAFNKLSKFCQNEYEK